MSDTPEKGNITLQNKVFIRWFADQLAKGNSSAKVENIAKDLSSGVAFVELSKILTGKEPKKA